MGHLDLRSALALHQAGRLEEAEALYRKILSTPAAPEIRAPAVHLLGMLCRETGRMNEAVELMRESIALAPSTADFHSNLAGVLGQLGRPHEAIAHLQEALRLAPAFPQAHNNLGVALDNIDRLNDAERLLRRATELRPGYAEAHYNLGNVLRKLGRTGEALEHHVKATRFRPDYADAHHALATLYERQGRIDDALSSYRRVLQIRPGSAAAHSDLLLALHYHAHSGNDPEALFAEHLRWEQRHAAPLYPKEPLVHGNARGPDRTLRVGYLSADFRDHPIARFVAPALFAHDRDRFVCVCYSDLKRPDAVTERLRAQADEWYDVTRLSDDQVADRIRRDRIDILIDLGGHMGFKRLLVFARKPAPVQVTYIGYPDTTGLATIDYRITDGLHDPLGQTERYHSEQLVRLPGSCWCYDPTNANPGVVLPVTALPADRRNGRVTFGCMNRLIKVTPLMVDLWSQILIRVPASRLLILAGDVDGNSLREAFRRHGISEERLTVLRRCSRQEYLKLYGQVDILLDTFPYNGHTTTLDALWMGTPTVSLCGRTHVSRAGLSVLSAVGLAELVATTAEEYVQIAVLLARDRQKLRRLRHELRDRMCASNLMDQQRFARALESAYRQMWSSWCTQRIPATAPSATSHI